MLLTGIWSMHSVNPELLVWRMAPVLLCLCISITANADEDRGVLQKAGARVSLARTTYGGEFIENSPAKRIPVLGFGAAIFAHLEFVRLGGVGFGLEPELGYTPRGADVELGGMFIGDARAGYLELPILARVESPAVGPVALQAAAGPVLGLLLKAEAGNMNGEVSDASDGTSTLDVALAAGAGATVAVTSRVAVNLETRYVHGLLTTDDTGEVEVQNRAIYFSLGVSFRLDSDETASLED